MRLFARILVGTLLLTGILAAIAAVPGEQRKQELSILKEQIRGLQDEIAHGEESHDEIADSVSAVDRAVSGAQRRLREVSAQRAVAEQQLRDLELQRKEVERVFSEARTALSEAVYRLYVEGGHAGARRFLSGDEPNQLSRDAYYLELIARQRLEVIQRSRSALSKLTDVITQTEARKVELVLLEKEHRQGQEVLLVERRKQREILLQVSSQLRSQRKQMQTLQRDESRIEKLLKGLERISQSQPARKASQALPPSSLSNSGSQKKNQPPELTDSDTGVQESQGNASSVFAAMKGRLRWPVKGALNGRFGSPRLEGGSVWRGVFIRSSSGQEVKAVAAGKVAFADWLRGFGNLMIIDHGDGYMTVYGNNEALFKNPGDGVIAGETIASVGSSGGLDESGLYFEIRYRGQAQDPAKWVVAK